MEILLQLVVEIFSQVLFEIVAELGLESLKAAFERPNRHPVLASLGYLLLGAVFGGVTLFVRRGKFFQPGPMPGLSLIVSPLCVGLIMEAWGRFRRDHGHTTTNLATFSGGAAFAFGTAIIRFLWTN
ncbi:MAG: hypothetical protein EPO39_08170 [Candidatus Manganitrophaceae bacterium]|nr:MAG: hypothetical protein EPO39_08170 [Candidatus Manganitrophaceae bacterium]